MLAETSPTVSVSGAAAGALAYRTRGHRVAMASMIVLYGQPEDPAAFEEYYAEQHLPFAAEHMSGVTGAENRRLAEVVRGGPGWYRLSVMTFESPEVMRTALASDGGRAVLDDLDEFATGGATVVLSDD
jgi:uncharacterized protein (TIGR02118 family)